MSEATVSASSALTLTGVFKGYGSTQVLENCTMSVNPGDFYVVSGAPSSGKSVLLRIVLGLELGLRLGELPSQLGILVLQLGDLPVRRLQLVPQHLDLLVPVRQLREARRRRAIGPALSRALRPKAVSRGLAAVPRRAACAVEVAALLRDALDLGATGVQQLQIFGP